MIPLTQKKLREAIFFLDHLREQARQPPSDPEHFEFFLSAFLAAARSVTFALHAEEKEKYEVWKDGWFAKQSPENQQVLGFLKKQRNVTQKRGEAEITSSMEEIPITEMRLPTAGQSPYYGFQWEFEPPRVGVPVHRFKLGENEVEVVQACERYTALLDQLVKDFLAKHPPDVGRAT